MLLGRLESLPHPAFQTRSKTSVSKAAPAPLVEDNYQYDDQPLGDPLPKCAHIEQIEAVRQHPHDKSANERANNTTFPAEKIGPSNNHCGDGTQVLFISHQRIG